jgi:hypothetical protein
MEIISRVESAMKATAPIVGIPLPGERPFCLKRKLLVDSLKGLTVIDAALQLPLDKRNGKPMLVVYAVGERVQAIRKFYPCPEEYYQIKFKLRDWAEAQRAKLANPAPKLDKYGKQLAKLQKQLDKLWSHRPKNPATYRNGFFRRGQLVGWAGEYQYKQIARWKAERSRRQQLNMLGKRYYGGEITKEQLEAELSKLGTSIWGRGLDSGDFRQFYTICDGLVSKVQTHEYWKPDWGIERLKEFCSDDNRPARDELRAQIQAVKALQC